MLRSLYYFIKRYGIQNNYRFLFFELSWIGLLVFILLILIILLKLPIFLLHFWLPKVHVEAPVEGSIILAGVIIKMGGWGLLCLLKFLQLLAMKINFFISSISFYGLLFIRILCYFVNDIKKLIAYSSIAHMTLGIHSLMSIKNLSHISLIMLIFSHGLVSPLLFKIVSIYSEIIGTRTIEVVKGVFEFKIFFIWFLVVIGNISSPPRLNFVSEIILTIVVLSFHLILILILLIGNIIISLYRTKLLIINLGEKKLLKSCFKWKIKNFVIFYWFLLINLMFVIFILVFY